MPEMNAGYKRRHFLSSAAGKEGRIVEQEPKSFRYQFLDSARTHEREAVVAPSSAALKAALAATLRAAGKPRKTKSREYGRWRGDTGLGDEHLRNGKELRGGKENEGVTSRELGGRRPSCLIRLVRPSSKKAQAAQPSFSKGARREIVAVALSSHS